MFIKTKIALAAAMVAGIAVSASAATKHDRLRGLHAQVSTPHAPSAFDSDSPGATGGGSIGYNQNIYNW